MTIAGLGSPPILVLDEPTTGLDIISRRLVWEIIQQYKKTQAVLLTTHCMEEADVLGDRIAIMAAGLVMAEGTSLQLKQQYGRGYRLSLIVKEGKVDIIRNLVMSRLIQSAQLVDKSASSLVFSVCLENMSDL